METEAIKHNSQRIWVVEFVFFLGYPVDHFEVPVCVLAVISFFFFFFKQLLRLVFHKPMVIVVTSKTRQTKIAIILQDHLIKTLAYKRQHDFTFPLHKL